jgi:hypothetical protein
LPPVSLPDRLAAVPRPWWVVGGSVVAVVSLFLTLAAVGGDDSMASVDSASPASTTSSVPPDSAVSTAPRASTTVRSTTTIDPDEYAPPDEDEDDPAVVARPIPEEPDDAVPPTTLSPPPWAASTRVMPGGYLGADVGCARDLGADGLDAFLADRVGPVLGWDYQHVYALGGDRYLWLFQDAFVDHTGAVSNLGNARFVHNAALLQTGKCFTLLHRGTAAKPAPFEDGNGVADVKNKWYWPMGGEVSNGQLWMFWAEMLKDPYDPAPPDGLGWHPNKVYIAAYDVKTLARLAFYPAPDSGAIPMYGYAVSSDASYSYLFGNTFEQNMVREGGFWNGPHSATQMFLARVPRGVLSGRPEYRTADGWSPNRDDAVPISERFYAENPMQPRLLDGQWVAATKVDGYWGEDLVIDVAPDPWGPWTTVDAFRLQPRGNDPRKNTYHAHLLPWRDKFGSVLVTVSNNARNMLRDAWPRPDRYRPMVTYSAFRPTPPPPDPTTTMSAATTTLEPTTTVTTVAPTTITVSTTSIPTTPPPTTHAPTTSTIATTTTSSSSTTSTSSTTVAP